MREISIAKSLISQRHKRGISQGELAKYLGFQRRQCLNGKMN